MLDSTTIRPGLLVSLNTSITGNVDYQKTDIEAEHLTDAGEKKARWETLKTVQDPDEYERAKKVRGKASTLIRGVCAKSKFGLLCPDQKAKDLEARIAEARRIIEDFNADTTITKVGVYVVTGRVASNDAEAIRALNYEVRGLISEMERGLETFDVDKIAEAANRAKNLGQMLAPEAKERVESAISVARKVRREIVKAGESIQKEVDREALKKLSQARTAFLDLDDAKEVATPVVEGRGIDLAPELAAEVEAQKITVPALELE